MKPKPFSALNHLTVPEATLVFPFPSHACAQGILNGERPDPPACERVFDTPPTGNL
jgi:hypothetical protein